TEAAVSSGTPNGQTLGAGADLWPPANGPGGGSRNSTWTAEIIWPTSNLKTKQGVAITDGKIYRLQIILHSGDKNDIIGMACTQFKAAPVTPSTATAGAPAAATGATANAPAGTVGAVGGSGIGTGGSNSPG